MACGIRQWLKYDDPDTEKHGWNLFATKLIQELATRHDDFKVSSAEGMG